MNKVYLIVNYLVKEQIVLQNKYNFINLKNYYNQFQIYTMYMRETLLQF